MSDARAVEVVVELRQHREDRLVGQLGAQGLLVPLQRLVRVLGVVLCIGWGMQASVNSTQQQDKSENPTFPPLLYLNLPWCFS